MFYLELIFFVHNLKKYKYVYKQTHLYNVFNQTVTVYFFSLLQQWWYNLFHLKKEPLYISVTKKPFVIFNNDSILVSLEVTSVILWYVSYWYWRSVTRGRCHGEPVVEKNGEGGQR